MWFSTPELKKKMQKIPAFEFYIFSVELWMVAGEICQKCHIENGCHLVFDKKNYSIKL
jgi:hypothetical protein